MPFDAPADAYERGRPGYPDDFHRYVETHLGLRPGDPVLDLGAGTGKLTQLLIDARLAVWAVEPLKDMRRSLTARTATVLAGKAEEIPLGDGAVEAVFVGQAYHWFEYERALPEIHRVLRPSGILCLVWNRRVDREPWHRAYDDLIAPYRTGSRTVDSVDWTAPLLSGGLFEQLADACFSHTHRMSVEELCDRVRSLGYVARLGEPARERLLERLARAVEPAAATGGGSIALDYDSTAYIFRRADP